MNRIFLSIALVFLAAFSAAAQFAQFQAATSGPTVTCNLVTGAVTGTGSGPCTSGTSCVGGATDNAAAFLEFQTWAIAWQGSHTGQVELYLPPGSVCNILDGAAVRWAKGVKDLLVIAYGASLGNNNGSGTVFWLTCGCGIKSGSGFYGNTNIWTGRLQGTVAAGSTSAIMLNPGGAANNPIGIGMFSVGDWALITGFDVQGGDSTPPGPHYLEYVQITAIDSNPASPTYGKITFAAPLQNTYLSTWPNYSAGSPGSAHDQGGPGTIYALDQDWNARVEYRGLTWLMQNSYSGTEGRTFIFRDGVFNGDYRCVLPSQTESWSVINSDMSTCTLIETDKLVTTARFSGVTVGGQIFVQSSSFDNLYIDNSTITTLSGTAKRTYITDTTITTLFKPGVQAFGRSDEVVCTRCNLISGISVGGFQETAQGFGINNSTYSISGGTITSQISATNPYPSRWAVPGTNVCWAGLYDCMLLFQVVAVTQSGDDTIITTTLSNTMNDWPTVPLQFGTNLYLQVHPAPSFTCIDCYGSADALAANNAPPGAPIYSYVEIPNTTWAWTSTFNDGGGVLWGVVTSTTFNIATKYTGSVDPFTVYIGPAIIRQSAPSPTTSFWLPTFDMRSGPRTVTILPPTSSVTGNVGGDSSLLPSWTDSWVVGGFGFASNQNISADVGTPVPNATLILQSDQGVVYPYTVP